ncbi:carbohydrate-binding module family 1 protein [Colletotrichum tofieldiae]|nr:carbohydrate-binding module family 1 protein [Colletotrichum tofieldiae]GKT74065.1 carbohydrate-binding module family 1 protein [Colletotrichum tofieldiae]
MGLLSVLATGLSTTLLFSSVTAQSTVPAWGQCGGNGWSGATTCVSGYTCSILKYDNPNNLVSRHSLTLSKPLLPPVHSGIQYSYNNFRQARLHFHHAHRDSHQHPHNLSRIDNPRDRGGGGAVPTTLVSGWYWIRAVASPNFHSYLQAKPTGTPSKAYLEAPSGAGQFKIEAGQLVHLTGSTSLYLNVENPTDKTQRKLETWFSAGKNTYGTFAFQGDTLTWSTPDINRPNLAAWLVCENQEVFINTGAYLYQTPAGCFDQTIHSYGGSTADL